MNKKQLESLYDICSYTRAAGSQGEHHVISNYIKPIADYRDDYGNYYKHVSSAPVIWSCHTDTVHRDNDPTKQTVYVDDQSTRLFKGKDGMCLGADCGTGIWIMLQMIKAQVPGLYIFHRAEEIGGLGSGWIADHPEASTCTDYDHWLQQYEQCIAFDRYGNNSIITHQGMERTASDEYAHALSELLDMGHRPDTGGSFTDSKNYSQLIPECTNLSVGYMHQHSNSEYQDLTYLLQLTERLCDVGEEIGNIGTFRDPTKTEVLDYGKYNLKGYTVTEYDYYDDPLVNAICTYPEAVISMLRHSGYAMDDAELAQIIEDNWVWGDESRQYG